MSNRPNTRKPLAGGAVRRIARMRSIHGIPVHMGRWFAEHYRKIRERQEKVLDKIEDAAIRREAVKEMREPPEDLWGDTVLYLLPDDVEAVAVPLTAAQDAALREAKAAWDAENGEAPEKLDQPGFLRWCQDHGRPMSWNDLPLATRGLINAEHLIDHAIVGVDLLAEDEDGEPVEVSREDGAEVARAALRGLLLDPPALDQLDQLETAWRWASRLRGGELRSLPKGQALPLEPKGASPVSSAAAGASTKTDPQPPAPKGDASSNGQRPKKGGGRRQAA